MRQLVQGRSGADVGVVDFIQGGVQELRIARPRDARHLIWTHPNPSIAYGAELTLAADEVAVFASAGVIVGVLTSEAAEAAHAGRRILLDARSAPFLEPLAHTHAGAHADGDAFVVSLFLVSLRDAVDSTEGQHRPGKVPIGMTHAASSYRVVDVEAFVRAYCALDARERAWLDSLTVREA